MKRSSSRPLSRSLHAQLLKLLAGLLLLYGGAVAATGWLDYELDIGNGYSIFRPSALDVSLARNHVVIVSRSNFSEIGPIVGYFNNHSHIFLRAVGWKRRNAFPQDEFKEIDSSKEFFFVVHVRGGEVTGPLSRNAFLQNPVVTASGSFEWIKPKNPNFWLPLLGTVYFILLSIPILYVIYWYVSLPATVLMVYGLVRWRAARRKRLLQPT